MDDSEGLMNSEWPYLARMLLWFAFATFPRLVSGVDSAVLPIGILCAAVIKETSGRRIARLREPIAVLQRQLSS